MLTTVFSIVGVLLAAPLPQPPHPPHILLLSGSQTDGLATELWLAILRHRLDPVSYDSVARLRQQRTPEQDAWARLIQAREAHRMVQG